MGGCDLCAFRATQGLEMNSLGNRLCHYQVAYTKNSLSVLPWQTVFAAYLTAILANSALFHSAICFTARGGHTVERWPVRGQCSVLPNWQGKNLLVFWFPSFFLPALNRVRDVRPPQLCRCEAGTVFVLGDKQDTEVAAWDQSTLCVSQTNPNSLKSSLGFLRLVADYSPNCCPSLCAYPAHTLVAVFWKIHL